MSERQLEFEVMPEALAREIDGDLVPVRPLLSTSLRVALLSVVAATFAVLLLLLSGARSDLQRWSVATITLVLAARLMVGISLLFVAMREAIPASGWSVRVRTSAFAVAGLTVVALPELFASAIGERGGRAVHPSACFVLVLLVALPTLVSAVVLLLRAYPLQPARTTAAAALGTAVLAEAAVFMACDNVSPVHGWLMHVGAVVAMTAAGVLAGVLITRSRRQRRTFVA